MILLKNIITKFINLLKEPWGNIIELKPKLETIETNSQFAQIVSPSESIALITFNLKIGDTEGMINIAIPHYVIEPILPNLSSKLWFQSSIKKELTDEERIALREGVEKSHLDIRSVIGHTMISVREFLSLQIGDVVILDRKVGEDFEVYVDKDVKYLGQPGTSNAHMAIKITDNLEEGDEIYG